MKMIFNYDANKTHFHNKGFALSLVLKVRFFGTRKWPIPYHEQAGQHLLSPTVSERLQFEQWGIMSGKKTNLR